MITQESPRPTVTLGDVLAVLEMARTRLDPTRPVPTSWDAAIDQMRAALVERAAPPSAPGDSTGQDEGTGSS